MRTFANLFLVLFLADGSLSLLDEMVTLISPTPALSAFRASVANAVIYLAFPLYLSLGVDRRLPKGLFLPLIAFLFLCPLSAWIFPHLSAFPVYGLIMAALQIGLGTFLISRTVKNREALTLPAGMFEGPFFSARNTLLFCGINVVVLPLFAATLALYLANGYAAVTTAGFIEIRPGGLYMVERVYRQKEKSVRLASMIHVGEKQYYQDVARLPVSGRTIVLAEGVTDEKGRLSNRFDYGKVASFLGLTSQEKMLFEGRVIAADALDAPESGKGGLDAKEPDILRADVDLASFRPETLVFLNAVGRELHESPSVVEGMVNLNAWSQKNVTPESYAVIMDDILHQRNKVVLGHMDKALRRYDTVVIPWGAMHMKEIEAEVLKRGFVLQEEKKRKSVDFGRMLTDKDAGSGNPAPRLSGGGAPRV